MTDNLNYKAAIFDLDGTLINSMPFWENAVKKWGRKNNIDADENLLKNLMYKKPQETIEYLNNTYSGIDGEKVFKKLCMRAAAFYIGGVKPVLNAKQYLEQLRKNNVKIALLTNCPPFLCRMSLMKNGMNNLFDVKVFSKDYPFGKDKPNLFLIAAQKLNVKPEECMVYEDSYIALSGARAAGMGFTAVLASDNAYVKNLKEEADRVIYHY